MSNDDLSRRDALGGGAAAVLAGVGAALAVTAAGREASAQTNASDAAKLNALLRAEYDAVLTYTVAENYLAMPDGTDSDRPSASAVRDVCSHFKSHHSEHAARLSTMVMSLGSTPVSRGEVLQAMLPTNFRATVMNLIKLAANKEKKAAIEYTRALQSVSSATAADLVAAIGGTETQHFIILHLVGQGVFTIQTMMPMVQALSPRAFVSLVDSSASGSTLAGLTDIMYTA